VQRNGNVDAGDVHKDCSGLLAIAGIIAFYDKQEIKNEAKSSDENR
jgi:hypothetical protein